MSFYNFAKLYQTVHLLGSYVKGAGGVGVPNDNWNCPYVRETITTNTQAASL